MVLCVLVAEIGGHFSLQNARLAPPLMCLAAVSQGVRVHSRLCDTACVYGHMVKWFAVQNQASPFLSSALPLSGKDSFALTRPGGTGSYAVTVSTPEPSGPIPQPCSPNNKASLAWHYL